jgi:hypothetical protein
MYERPATDAELDAFGFSASDYEHEQVEVWPENWQAFDLFRALSTQWRVGMAGPTGLDYNTLFHKMDRMRLEPDEYDELEADIRTMEFAALGAMNTKE